MESMHSLFDKAKKEWREKVCEHFPIRANTKVIKKVEPIKRNWSFATDFKQIFVNISNDENLKEKFENVVAKYWKGNPENLAKETMVYLLWHELYHPIEAHFSEEDKKKISQAIRKGALKAEPNLSPLEQMTKVMFSLNAIEDFILDNRFYLDNKKENYVRDDVVPIWDFLELYETYGEIQKTDFYTITRYLYGILYGPKSTYKFFEDKTGKEGVGVAERIIKELIGRDVCLSKPMVSENDDVSLEQILDSYSEQIREVFSGKGRYVGIERIMSILSPYIKEDMSQGKGNIKGEKSGISPQNILQDLLDDMTPKEQEKFLQELGEEKEDTLNQLVQNMQSQLDAKSTNINNESENDTTQGEDSLSPNIEDNLYYLNEIKHLNLLAIHEFYKRNHPKVSIIGGTKSGESLVVDEKEYWYLKNEEVLSQHELAKINIKALSKIQEKTKLPWLINLGKGMYLLREYVLKKKDVKDLVYKDLSLDVPEIVEFYLDSSASMDNTIDQVTGKSGLDLLYQVLYGFVDALEQGERKVSKSNKFRIHNFADHTVTSDFVTPQNFLKGNTEVLQVLYEPKNGGSTNLNLTNFGGKEKRVYVVVTDGEVFSYNTELNEMKEIVKNPNSSVVFFEIGRTYALGNAVRNCPNITYMQVHNAKTMFETGLEVLLGK